MDPLKYLDTYESKNTVSAYKQALKVFLWNIYGNGELPVLATRYMSETRDHKEDLQDFLAKIKARPPTTVRLYLSAVRTFLTENDVELPQRFWRSLNRRVKGSMAATQDRIPSNAELRRIIMHMPVHGKALYLSLASSGMRIGETLQLELSDISLDSDPVQIDIRREYTKSGNPRHAFISSEAKEHIQEYLKYRSEYLKSASRRSRYAKTTKDARLFPFNLSTAHVIWTNALDKSQLNHKDKSTNRYKIHPHVLRKFFRTRMGSVIPVDVTEALMGHKGYLTDVYRRYSAEDLARFYKQGEDSVAVFGKIEANAQIKQDVAKLNRQILDLNRELADVKTKLTTWEALTKLTPEELELIGETIRERIREQQKKEDGESREAMQRWQQQKERELTKEKHPRLR